MELATAMVQPAVHDFENRTLALSGFVSRVGSIARARRGSWCWLRRYRPAMSLTTRRRSSTPDPDPDECVRIACEGEYLFDLGDLRYELHDLREVEVIGELRPVIASMPAAIRPWLMPTV